VLKTHLPQPFNDQSSRIEERHEGGEVVLHANPATTSIATTNNYLGAILKNKRTVLGIIFEFKNNI
jgi:hypothetical protein